MTFDPQKPIDAAFTRFGVDLIIDPDDAQPRTVRAMVAGDSADEFYAGRQVRQDGGGIRVRVADLAFLPSGARIEFLGERRTVQGEPAFEDPRRLVATLSTSRDR